MAQLAPSILSADLLQLEQQIKTVEANGANVIHVDVMDGSFVPNITFGPVIVKTLKKITNLPLDVHLMINNPEKYISAFADAGAHYITVHQEAVTHMDRVVNQIKEAGCKAGISINPATPVHVLQTIHPYLDLILLMTVNPGYGGQSFIPYSLEKIKQLARMKKAAEASYIIEVDGGINPETAESVVQAGAELLVAGNAVFGQPDIAKSCKALKELIQG